MAEKKSTTQKIEQPTGRNDARRPAAPDVRRTDPRRGATRPGSPNRRVSPQ